MWKTSEGSTGRLLQLCLAYFVFYVITGVTVKYFISPAAKGFPGMQELEFLFYSTTGGTAVALSIAVACGWFKMRSERLTKFGPFQVPIEYAYILPSGICTAVVIPTTTLMYSLPISVMVAMVIMRGSVIVVSRLVDEVQIRQGLLKKEVYWSENVAVIFAVLAIATKIFLAPAKDGAFDFIHSVPAMTILSSYIVAYAIRIYIMNYYKNTRTAGISADNKGFFAVEQIAAVLTLLLVGSVLFYSPSLFGWHVKQIDLFRGAIVDPRPMWEWAIVAGMAFGMVSFVSVFIFMFKGRTATFAGLVNRLTSLVAGTAATITSFMLFGGKLPSTDDWVSLGFILVSVGFLTLAEKRRVAELRRAHEIETESAPQAADKTATA